MVKCDTITITFDHVEEGRTKLVVPTFTRTQESLIDLIAYFTGEYLSNSEGDDQPVSLSDFALYLMLQASKEPTEQDEIAE